MEYHHSQAYHNHHHQQQQQQQQQQQLQSNGHSYYPNLPDASQSSEKALLWSQTQYMTESGYSTQAPSISSIDAFLNNEQMDNTMHQMDTISESASSSAITTTNSNVNQTQAAPTVAASLPPVSGGQTQQSQEWTQQPSTQPPVQQQTQNSDDNSNPVANWINYQDNVEMALKAIPELLKLLLDEDLVVVQQAAILLNQMARNEAPRLGLIQTENAVQCLVDCLNTTADLETARCLLGALYGVSTQKPSGTQAIINSKALQPLVKMLSAPMETIVSYTITTLHNIILDCGDKVKMQLRKMGAIHQMIPLLTQSPNVKFLSIVVDCIHLLAFGNQDAKKLILELGGTQALVSLLLNQCQYQKLVLNTSRLLKGLSVCSKNKEALIKLNAMQAISMYLLNPLPSSTSSSSSSTTSSTTSAGSNTNTKIAHDIAQNFLITIRNLSDMATRLNGLEQLVQNLLHLISQSSNNDLSISTPAACALSNFTCNNENNKKAALRANGIQILLKVLQSNMLNFIPQLAEPCLCALRHITNKHSDMLLAHEQVRSINGLSLITQMMSMQPRSWTCVKPLLGIARNFCSNQLNSNHLRSNGMIEKLMQILYEAFTEINIRTNNGQNSSANIKIDDVNLMDILDISSQALVLLAKENQNQIIMKDLDCITFFVSVFYSPISNFQKAGSSILAELASNRECALVIEQQPGFHQFVQANFCNQFGQLKTIAELNGNNISNSANNTNATNILQNVTTLMQRLQEHKMQSRASFVSSQFPPQVSSSSSSSPAQHQNQPQSQPLTQSVVIDQFTGMPIHQSQSQPQLQAQANQSNMMYYPNGHVNMPNGFVNHQQQQPGLPQQFQANFY